MIAGLLLTETSAILYRMYPETANIEYDLFLSKKFHFKISVLWYIYELTNIINRVIWAYVFTLVSLKYSRNLYWVGVTFMLYECSQFFFYIWNRNTSLISNILVYVCMGFIVLEILIPSKILAKVRRMD